MKPSLQEPGSTFPPAQEAFQIPVCRRAVSGLVGLWMLLQVAGCGIGLGEGGGQPIPPPLPESLAEKERKKARVTGRVQLAPALRKRLAAVPPGPVATGSAQDPMRWDGHFLPDLEASLSTPETDFTTEVERNGVFTFPPVQEGRYDFQLSSRDSPVLTATLLLDRKAKARLVVEVLGRDFADLDGDQDSREWVTRLDLFYRAAGIEFTRQHLPGGLVRTVYPEGTLEIGAPEKEIRVLNPDGSRETRSRSGQVEPLPAPLILAAEVTPILDPDGTGTGLLKWHVQVDLMGETSEARVRVALHPDTRISEELELLDDGSIPDLNGSLAGHQGSGDDLAGDGNFTLLTIVDASTYSLLREGVAVVETLTPAGEVGCRLAVYLDGPPRTFSSQPSGGLVGRISDVALRAVDGGYRAVLAFHGSPPDSLRSALLGPTGKDVPLMTTARAGGFDSPVLATREAGYYYVVLASAGDVFHCGAPLSGGPESGKDVKLLKQEETTRADTVE